MIRLELLSERHLAALDPICRDPEVLRFTRIPDPPPPDFPQTWVARYESGRADGTKEAFAMVDEEGTLLGVVLAPEIHAEAQEAELGYMVAVEARGRGVASEGLRLMTEWAFRERGLLRVVLYIAAENVGSQKVARNCGYTREGLLRSIYVKRGVREDNEIWSRLPSDP